MKLFQDFRPPNSPSPNFILTGNPNPRNDIPLLFKDEAVVRDRIRRIYLIMKTIIKATE